MTQSDPKEGENSFSCWEILQQHSDKAAKVCIWILGAMCVGALIVITILLTSPHTSSNEISEHYTTIPLEARILDIPEHKSAINACQVNNCTIECRDTSRIYRHVFAALQEASCQKDIILNIYNQRFPNSVLRNRWIPANKVIKEVSITSSNFSNILNEAFNSIDFTNTKVLTIVGFNVSALGNGVLLGLSKLHSLHLVGKVGQIDRCFFQPIQASLIQLRLGVELTISGDINVFGVSHLPKIEALDLSDNTIEGPLSKNFFVAVPNVKILTLSNSKITSIDEDAFDDIAGKLEILDLSNNLLTIIDITSMERLLTLRKVNLYLLGNDWYCNCDLQPLIKMHAKFYDRFGDIPYCKGPAIFYGVLFTNVTYAELCEAKVDEGWTLETTSVNNLKTESSPPIIISPTIGISPTTEVSTSEETIISPSPFQMRCLSVLTLPSDEDSSSSSEQMEYFLFAPPCHEFELILLENSSVQVVVENADEPINIVWFSDAVEDFAYTIDGVTVDYNCEGYTDPYLIVDNLLENSTYTFCLVPVGTYSITPFNCLPLHVPISRRDEDSIWISTDEKQFTVGIVCLIFTCSMLLGGVIAFFGIKAYPDLLEGSRHVLVVKKSDQTCYVSTITEGEYIINQKTSLKKNDSLKKIPLPVPITPPPPPFPIPMKYEENTDEFSGETEDHYELPCIYNKTHDCKLQCIPNKYAMSPISPPPLPKRNSDILLYSSNTDVSPDKPHSKMSF